MRRNLRYIVAVATGTAVAAAAVTTALISTFRPPPGTNTVNVPLRYAALTNQQRNIVRLGVRHGVGSGIYYVWGGTTHRGFDCSGFVWHVVREATGIRLPRTAEAMTRYAPYRDPRGQERPGDILRFYNGGHVGLYLGNRTFVEYFSSGRPARYGRLPHFGYQGAYRYWKPAQVRKRTYWPALFVVRHWRIRIVGHHGDTVVFVPHKGAKTFGVRKRRAILAWAHSQRHPVKGFYNHININLFRKGPPPPPTHWQKVKATAAFVAHHFGVRISHHTAAGVATFRTRSGKAFAPWRRKALVSWARNHHYRVAVPDKRHVKIWLWPPQPPPPNHWAKVKATATFVAHHFGVRLSHHTRAGVATYMTRSGRAFAPWRRRALVTWAKNHKHKVTVPDRKHVKIWLWPLASGA